MPPASVVNQPERLSNASRIDPGMFVDIRKR